MSKTKKAHTARDSFRAGLLVGFPIIAGLVPFALIYGAAARNLGLSLGQTMGMSIVIFAGSSQLVFLDLWAQSASALSLILTCMVINLRMAMYSASLAPHLGKISRLESFFGAYLLTDESYGLTMGKILSGRAKPLSPFYFYVGAALPTWFFWNLCSFGGYIGGALIPASWPLSMAVPLVFLLLLASMVSKGPKLTAAIAAMVAAIAAADAPMKLGLIVAVFTGVGAGCLHDKIIGLRIKRQETGGGS